MELGQGRVRCRVMVSPGLALLGMGEVSIIYIKSIKVAQNGGWQQRQRWASGVGLGLVIR